MARPATSGRASGIDVSGQNIAKGEFRGTARWVASAYPPDPSGRAIIIGHSDAGIGAGGEDPSDGSGGLGALLGAIADEVRSHAAAAREGVVADFAGRVAHARKHLSPQLLAATLAAIREQRKAALALIGRNMALELSGRQKAAVAAFGGNRPRRLGRRGPSDNPSSPPQAPRL